ncbi:MAG TPA: hypothetical protein VFE21_09490 [Rubrobacteraceae bacterium]|nr:hypothetical protein [Rubrobacteraceae bacterium]
MSGNTSPNKNGDRSADARLFWGRAACGVGVILAAAGIVAALSGTGASILPGAVGACLGILGYFLGSNRFGSITIILCTAGLFFWTRRKPGAHPRYRGLRPEHARRRPCRRLGVPPW